MFEEKRRAYLARAVEADPDDPGTLIEVAKQAARDGDAEAVARALRRRSSGAERRRHPRHRGLVRRPRARRSGRRRWPGRSARWR